MCCIGPHKISCKITWICCFVRNYQYLTRTCDHIDVNNTVKQFLCSSNEDISGADDLVHLRDGLRAIGQRSNSLRAAFAPNSILAVSVAPIKIFLIAFMVVS